MIDRLPAWAHELTWLGAVKDAARGLGFVLTWHQARQAARVAAARALWRRSLIYNAQMCHLHWLPEDRESLTDFSPQWCGCTEQQKYYWALMVNGYMETDTLLPRPSLFQNESSITDKST